VFLCVCVCVCVCGVCVCSVCVCVCVCVRQRERECIIRFYIHLSKCSIISIVYIEFPNFYSSFPFIRSTQLVKRHATVKSTNCIFLLLYIQCSHFDDSER